jgi:gluconolactonase
MFTRIGLGSIVVIIFVATLGTTAQEKSPALPDGLVAPGTVAEAFGTVAFLEGPAVDADGNVFFSDIAGNRIMKMDAKGGISVFRADSGRTNGNYFDAQGRLISCEGNEQGPGRRRIVRTDMKSGKVDVLSDKFDGKRYNSPNDVCVDSKGRVWFTDPFYGPDRSSLELDVEGVYRIDLVAKVPPEGKKPEREEWKATRVLTQKEIQRPNGIAMSPDDKTLYVVDSHPKPGGNRKVWAFDVADDGSLSKQRLIYDFGKGRGGDGLRLDTQGNLWVAAGISVKRGPGETLDNPPGVYVISPAGKLLGRIPIPENLITNLAFGGPERKTLYVTAGKTVYRVPVNVSGYALYPK